MFASTRGGVPRQLGSLGVCLVVLTYVFFGGMRGTAWANAFQTAVFMVLGFVTFQVIATRLGGTDSLWDNLHILGTAIPPEKATRSEMSFSLFVTYMFIPLSVGMFPHLFQHWLTARSAATFKLPVVAHPIFIMIVWVPCVLIGVWAASDMVTLPETIAENPNRILPFLVKTQAGPVLGGFLAAGILAAIMSSLDSQFLCLGTIFMNDIVVHYQGRENVSDRNQVLLARGFIVAIVVFTYLLNLRPPASVFALGVWSFSGFASLFPLVFAALYWKRLTKWGAYAAVLAVFAVWAYYFQASDYGQIKPFTIDVPFFGKANPVVGMITASTIAMVAVSLLTTPPSKATLAKFFPE